MPRHTKAVERMMITENNIKDFNNRLNLEEKRLMRKGLEMATDITLSSLGFYRATVTGYKVIKEW